MAKQSFFVDRTKPGVVKIIPDYSDRTIQMMLSKNGLVVLHIRVDQPFVKVFGDDRRVVMTNLVFPDPTQDVVEIYSVGGTMTAKYVDEWTINSIWPKDSDQLSIGETKRSEISY